MAAAVRDPDPVLFFEAKGIYASKAEVPDGEIVDELGTAKVLRRGEHATIVALGMMVPRALAAAEELSTFGIEATVVDVRSLVPLDTSTILDAVSATSRLFTVEENPRLCGWGAELVSIVAEERFFDLDGPAHPDHDSAHPAARGQRARGRGATERRSHRRDRPKEHGLSVHKRRYLSR